ncbi:MAG: alkaline phosphatase family protein, partial [Roseimicrobium sp.]
MNDSIVVLVSVDGLAHFYLDDPKAEMPILRRLVAEGARAESMIASTPTVTWPNHTTLVTGVAPAKHGVLGNTLFDRAKGEVMPLLVDPLFSKDEIVKVPTVYDVAHSAGLRTAALMWPATRGAKSLHWTMPDVGVLELTKQYATPALLDEFTAAGIPWEKQHVWWQEQKGRERDGMFVQQMKHVLTRHRPNLALLHLVELDHVQHLKGPRSPEAYDAVKLEDALVGEVWAHLQREFPGKCTLVVVSDHGFFSFEQQILPNVLLRQRGLLTTLGSKITGGKVRAVSQGGANFIYVLDEENRSALTAQLAEAFRSVEGVELVLTPEEFAVRGLADPKTNPHMADLVLSAKSGYAFADLAAGDVVVTAKGPVKGAHGYDAAQRDMHATFIACGAGVRPGTALGVIRSTSVAPT